jgi:hypothetical protein
VEAREDAGAVTAGPPVVGFGPQRVPVQRVPRVVLLDGCEFAESAGEGGVSFDGVDRKLDARVAAEQVFLGEADVEQPELLTGPAGLGPDDQPGEPGENADGDTGTNTAPSCSSLPQAPAR